jgi:hypothetical protein
MANNMKYTEFHFQQRDAHKEKDLERKETVKAKNTQGVRERIYNTSSDMVRLNMLNAGSFPEASQLRLVRVVVPTVLFQSCPYKTSSFFCFQCFRSYD